ncbi:MAG TPA: hypothetical protein VJZ73_20625, partial [Methylomirabilota bacterium]|nr:hypothetical protein [Methylomirabilota bacterium]
MKRMITALAMMLVLSATVSVAIAQQPTPPAAENSAAPAAPAAIRRVATCREPCTGQRTRTISSGRSSETREYSEIK